MLFPNANRISNFGFVKEISDVSWPLIYWKNGKAIKEPSVRILELLCFLLREEQYSLHICLQEDCAENLFVILKQKGV